MRDAGVHELSIALGIVEAASEELERRGGGRIRAVHLRLGTLSGVAKEALLFAYPLACEGSPLEGSSLVVRDEAATAYCPSCRAERPVAAQLCCSDCGGPATGLGGGRGIEVTALEIEA